MNVIVIDGDQYPLSHFQLRDLQGQLFAIAASNNPNNLVTQDGIKMGYCVSPEPETADVLLFECLYDVLKESHETIDLVIALSRDKTFLHMLKFMVKTQFQRPFMATESLSDCFYRLENQDSNTLNHDHQRILSVLRSENRPLLPHEIRHKVNLHNSQLSTLLSRLYIDGYIVRSQKSRKKWVLNQ